MQQRFAAGKKLMANRTKAAAGRVPHLKRMDLLVDMHFSLGPQWIPVGEPAAIVETPG
jgi:hypothetical protein